MTSLRYSTRREDPGARGSGDGRRHALRSRRLLRHPLRPAAALGSGVPVGSHAGRNDPYRLLGRDGGVPASGGPPRRALGRAEVARHGHGGGGGRVRRPGGVGPRAPPAAGASPDRGARLPGPPPPPLPPPAPKAPERGPPPAPP